MALNATTLATNLKSEISSQLQGVFTITDTSVLDKFAQALSTAIANKVVAHIQSAALVTGTVTSGPGSGGAVTGTVS